MIRLPSHFVKQMYSGGLDNGESLRGQTLNFKHDDGNAFLFGANGTSNIPQLYMKIIILLYSIS